MSRSPHHPFRSKLDEETAGKIRRRHRAGEAPRDLALKYDVALSTIYDVLAERTYAPALHVPIDTITLDSLRAVAQRAGQSIETYVGSLIRSALPDHLP